MAMTATRVKVTAHEKLQMQELIRMETAAVQKAQATLAMVSDPELRQEMTTSLHTGKEHLKCLLDFCRENQLVEGGSGEWPTS